MPKGYHFSGSVHSLADKILEDIHVVQDQVEIFLEQVRSGKHLGVTGKPLKHTIVVCDGGMDLGTDFVHEALAADGHASAAAEGRKLFFLSNIDPVDTFLTTGNLDPAKTLAIVVSKDFSSATLNARSARRWLQFVDEFLVGSLPGAWQASLIKSKV